jgi:hypothetical protein
VLYQPALPAFCNEEEAKIHRVLKYLDKESNGEHELRKCRFPMQTWTSK